MNRKSLQTILLSIIMAILMFGCSNGKNVNNESTPSGVQENNVTLNNLHANLSVTPVEEYLKMALSKHDSAFIDETDTLWGWGLNEDGMLGLGNDEVQAIPAIIDSDVRTVAIADMQHNEEGSPPHGALFYIKNDNTLWASGYNEHGELGANPTSSISRPQMIMEDADKIFIRSNSTSPEIYVLKLDGSLYYWQRKLVNKSYIIEPTFIANEVRLVIPDPFCTFIITQNYDLYLLNTSDEFEGIPGTLAYAEKCLVPEKKLEGVLYASRTFHMSILIFRKDGSVWVQNDIYSENEKPKKILEEIVACEVFFDTAIAIEEDGDVLLWMIDGSQFPSFEPIGKKASRFVINRWGSFSAPMSLYLLDSFGNTYEYNLENGLKQIYLTGVSDIYSEDKRAYFLRDNGELWVIGESEGFALGIIGKTQLSAPSLVHFNAN